VASHKEGAAPELEDRAASQAARLKIDFRGRGRNELLETEYFLRAGPTNKMVYYALAGGNLLKIVLRVRPCCGLKSD
jgi:hypothetical protein